MTDPKAPYTLHLANMAERLRTAAEARSEHHAAVGEHLEQSRRPDPGAPAAPPAPDGG